MNFCNLQLRLEFLTRVEISLTQNYFQSEMKISGTCPSILNVKRTVRIF